MVLCKNNFQDGVGEKEEGREKTQNKFNFKGKKGENLDLIAFSSWLFNYFLRVPAVLKLLLSLRGNLLFPSCISRF